MKLKTMLLAAVGAVALSAAAAAEEYVIGVMSAQSGYLALMTDQPMPAFSFASMK